ncbi:hypothetical protein N3K66_004566 [Trichothecium roseum]|uniref:Uncharacterized protein n=1 Tax=Trichothecium roseum TaxID=47278 RepID=A0ACC0V339_9HYPO|nr:hypothetical protein N3K66_004566 [Trichothecium roseum]
MIFRRSSSEGGGFAEAPKAPWADALQPRSNDGSGGGGKKAGPGTGTGTRRLPQCIAHRGFKARWPENSMGGFAAAAEAGAHALETDLHLSRDGVIVLSHDPNLKRCFGVDRKIADCEWEYLSGLESLREPREKLPRLEDLLVWLNGDARLHIWLLLDIKRDDDAKALVGALVKVLDDIKGVRPWEQRLILACWNATYLRACQRLLPAYPLAHTSFFLPYAGHFLPRVPGLGFNLFYRSLHGPLGAYFLRRAAAEGRRVFAWTVNDEEWMEWCVRKNLPLARGSPAGEGKGGTSYDRAGVLIDGVVTDDPALFLEVCERIEDEDEDEDEDGKVAPADGVRGGGGMKKKKSGGAVEWVKRAVVSVAINMMATTFFIFLFLRRNLDI